MLRREDKPWTFPNPYYLILELIGKLKHHGKD